MQTTVIKQGQSFFDAVIEATGDITNVFLMAKANDVCVTDIPAIDNAYLITGHIKANIVKELAGRGAPATLAQLINDKPISLDYVIPQIFPMI